MSSSWRRRAREEEDPEAEAPAPRSKRRRRGRPAAAAALHVDVGVVGDDATTGRAGGGGSSFAMVLVSGLPSCCSVLELKSRMQMYGAISRIRIDGEEGVGYVTYRSSDCARAAVAASVDLASGIAIGNTRVHISQVSDPSPQRHTGLGAFAPSKLLRAELPLRKLGRGNKKLSEGMASCSRSVPEIPYEGRRIVAYDDLL